MTLVVSDTSPLRALAHLSLLNILPALYGRVFVPPAVVRELSTASLTLPSSADFQVQSPSNIQLVSRLATLLDPGESEAIALAIELDADLLLMDEAKGRATAGSLGIAFRGVLGVLISAKAAGHVSAIHPLIVRLKNELNFYISARIVSEVLELVGESDNEQG